MRPRLLINAISLTHQGGGRNYVRNLLRELARDRRGFEPHVLCAQGRLSDDDAAGIPRIEVALPQGLGRLGTLGRVAYEQTLLPLRARRFDLLYCLADVAPRFPLAPCVVALRNLNIYDRRFYDTARTRLLFRLARLGVRGARAVVFPSAAAAEQIGPLVGVEAERTHVIHHGIALEAFETAPEPIEHDAPFLFLPANLERHKNIPLLFDALLALRDPRVELWIAGGDDLDPAWAAHLRSLIVSKGLKRRVRLLGSVPYERVLAYYRAASALAFPSLLETFGHPLLEAMLSETPIAAADLPSFREVAGDAALYFPVDDAGAAARVIDEALAGGEPVRARVAAGRERARRFTWKRSVDELARVFEKALD